MKMKLLISAVIAAAVCSNAFALHITKGKLISHKEWTTGNAIASYQPGTKTLQSMKRTLAKLDVNPSTPIFLASETRNAVAHVGERVSVNNNAFIWVKNNTESTRNYYYNFNICATKSDSIIECVYAYEQIELEPNGEFNNALSPELTVKFNEPGVYETTASSFVMGASRTMISDSRANITVS